MNIEEYKALPKEERTSLRRLMFGKECPSEYIALRDSLLSENAQTGWFPEPYGSERADSPKGPQTIDIHLKTYPFRVLSRHGHIDES